LTADPQAADVLRQQAARLPELDRPFVLQGSLDDLPALVAAQGQGDARFDAVVGRNALTQQADKVEAARCIAAMLRPGGVVSLVETIPRHTQRLYDLVNHAPLDDDLARRWVAAEESIYAASDDPMVNWEAKDLQAVFEAAGFGSMRVRAEQRTAEVRITPTLLTRWFALPHDVPTDGQRPSYAQHLLARLTPEETMQVQALLERSLRGQVVTWSTTVAYLLAQTSK
jgi:putative ATPase